jgi:hypothetical protein
MRFWKKSPAGKRRTRGLNSRKKLAMRLANAFGVNTVGEVRQSGDDNRRYRTFLSQRGF